MPRLLRQGPLSPKARANDSPLLPRGARAARRVFKECGILPASCRRCDILSQSSLGTSIPCPEPPKSPPASCLLNLNVLRLVGRATRPRVAVTALRPPPSALRPPPSALRFAFAALRPCQFGFASKWVAKAPAAFRPLPLALLGDLCGFAVNAS